MNIDVPLRDLGLVDPSALQSAVRAADESEWQANQLRQTRFDVHYKTQSLIMIFTETEDWPKARVCRESGWERLRTQPSPSSTASFRSITLRAGASSVRWPPGLLPVA